MIKKITLLVLFLTATISFGQGPDSITVTFSEGASTNCSGATISLVIQAEPVSEYSYLIFRTTESGEFTPFSFSSTQEIVYSDAPSETTVYRIRAFHDDGFLEREIEVTVFDSPNAGGNSFSSICSTAATSNLFDMLAEHPDMGGTWTAPDGSSFGVGDRALFDPSIAQEGVYNYTVLGQGGCSAATAQLSVHIDTSIHCSTKTSADLDGDGVGNALDLDDDNDGILDTEEDFICTGQPEYVAPYAVVNQNFGQGSPVTDTHVASDLKFSGSTTPDDLVSDGEYSVATSNHLRNASGYEANYAATDLIGNVDADGTIDGRYLMINMRTSSFVNQPIYSIDDLYLEKGRSYEFSIALNNLNNSLGEINPSLSIELVDNTSGLVLVSIVTGELPGGTDQWTYFTAQFTTENSVENASLRIVNNQGRMGNGNDLGIDNIILQTLACNVDGDQRPNYLDLDSDGDGLLDTIEAGLDPSLDADNDGVVDGDVDDQGIPLAVSGGLIEPLDLDGNNVPDYLEDQSTLSSQENTTVIQNFEIYPNPASEWITIALGKGSYMNSKITMYDILGSVVKRVRPRNTTMRIDISAIPSGVYFISITNPEASPRTRRFIVN